MGCEEIFSRRVGFGGGLAKHSVDERGGGGFARLLYEFHRFVDGGTSGNLVEEAKLIGPEAKRQRHGKIDTVERFFHMALEKKIEQAAPAKDAHREFGGERRVGRVDLCAELGVQQVARVRTFGFDAAENVVGDFSRDADGHGGSIKAQAGREIET